MQAIAAVAPVISPAVQASQFLPPSSQIPGADGAAPGAAGDFSQLVSQGLQNVNGQLLVSQTDLQRLALGDAQNLHQIMIRLEESRLSFQLMMQVRNRLLESYQDVMKMSI